jgi:hypothetical protein
LPLGGDAPQFLVENNPEAIAEVQVIIDANIPSI